MGAYSVCKRCVHKTTRAEYAVKVGGVQLIGFFMRSPFVF